MTYYYDDFGWLTSTPNGRETSIDPPQETVTKRANWTGHEWILVTYTTPPIPDPRPAQRAAIIAQLADIDVKSSSSRAIREAALGNTTWLAALDAQASELRKELTTL